VDGAHGIYSVRVPKPAQGYTAFMLELTYPTGKPFPLKFTTEIVVVPDLYPFSPPPASSARQVLPPRLRR
jgi:PhoPQ-activated pathogenicity-related protein